MTATVPLQDGIVYGPVDSRRLGRSLGINLAPQDRKVCSFDCVYCQYGPSVEQPVRYDPAAVPGVDAVETAVRDALDRLDREPDYLTLSGNGEPTSHPEFPAIVDRIREVAEHSGADLALFTNGCRLDDPAVRAAVGRIDDPFVKLDAGTPETFAAVNRPVGIEFEELLDVLASMDEVAIQAMQFEGEIGNLDDENVEAWIEAVEHVDPVAVDLYTIARPTAYDLQAASRERLDEIADRLEARGIPTRVSV
ncbi:MAG TPA: radical SAM protein [Natrialbaceae archaeon]|nr:radical SAM protein [Natrialbaceae archaeon]